MRHLLLALLLVCGCLITCNAADGTLGRAKNEVRPQTTSASAAASPAPASRPSSSPSGKSHAHDDNPFSDAILGFLLLCIVIIPAAGVYYGGQSVAPDGMPYDVGVVGIPYVQDHPGYLGDVRSEGPARHVGAQFHTEFGMIERDLQRYALGARLWLTGAVQIGTDYHRYFERRPEGGHDTLTLGCTDFSLGIPLTTRGHLHLGIGVTTYHDEIGTESGAAFVCGGDVFPMRPLVLSVSGIIGSVSNDYDDDNRTRIATLRASLGVCLDRFEIFGGWQSTWIGQVQLDGPMGGLRVWF